MTDIPVNIDPAELDDPVDTDGNTYPNNKINVLDKVYYNTIESPVHEVVSGTILAINRTVTYEYVVQWADGETDWYSRSQLLTREEMKEAQSEK